MTSYGSHVSAHFLLTMQLLLSSFDCISQMCIMGPVISVCVLQRLIQVDEYKLYEPIRKLDIIEFDVT